MRLSRLCRFALAIGLIASPALVNAIRPSETRSTGDARSPDETVIRRMEQERVDAGVRKDIAAVAAATADDYLQIDLDGKVLNKDAALQRIASSEFMLQSNPLDEMIIRVFGDTAVVTARSIPKGTRNGKLIETPIRYTRIYRKLRGQWKVIVFQMTRVAQE